MAAKVGKLGTTETAAVIVAAVFISNWLAAEYLSFPFAWCWGKRLLQPVFEPWLFVTNFMALAYFIACAWTMNAFSVAKGLMVLILVFGVPTFSEILLRLGKFCT